MVLKRLYDQVVTKVNAIKIPNTSGLVCKAQNDLDKQCLVKKIEDANKKIPNTGGLIKKTNLNTKITEI